MIKETMQKFLAGQVQKLLMSTLKNKEYSYEELMFLLVESLDLLKSGEEIEIPECEVKDFD